MTTIRPRVLAYVTRVREPDPRAVGLARMLGAFYGRGINGQTGSVRFGYPAIGTRAKFAGYANTPQLFRGYDPRKVAGGTFRGMPGQLPATSNPGTFGLNSPLQNAMATVTYQQMTGSPV